MVRNVLVCIGAAGLVLLACHGVKQSEPVGQADESSASSNEPVPVVRRKAPEATIEEPTTLLQENVSAYGTRIFSSADGAVIVTPEALFRVRQGQPTKKRIAQLGHPVARQGDDLVFWRDEKIRALPLDEGEERELLSLRQAPQFILSSGPRLAWLTKDQADIHSVQTSSAGSIHVLHASKAPLSSPAIHGEDVYFVEQGREGWRIGRASLDGSPVKFTKSRSSRPPSMLAPGPDGIFFYDGQSRGIRKLSFDLDQEESVREDAICSPLTVSNRVVCAHVGGIFDIPWVGADPRIVATEPGGPIADITATEHTTYWVADGGENRMIVRSAPLPAL